MNFSESNNLYEQYHSLQENNKDKEDFNQKVNRKTKTLIFKITENVIQLIIGSLTFVSGLAWNNYILKNHIINNNLMYPLGITVVTSLIIVVLSYFHFDPNQ